MNSNPNQGEEMPRDSSSQVELIILSSSSSGAEQQEDVQPEPAGTTQQDGENVSAIVLSQAETEVLNDDDMLQANTLDVTDDSMEESQQQSQSEGKFMDESDSTARTSTPIGGGFDKCRSKLLEQPRPRGQQLARKRTGGYLNRWKKVKKNPEDTTTQTRTYNKNGNGLEAPITLSLVQQSLPRQKTTSKEPVAGSSSLQLSSSSSAATAVALPPATMGAEGVNNEGGANAAASSPSERVFRTQRDVAEFLLSPEGFSPLLIEVMEQFPREGDGAYGFEPGALRLLREGLRRYFDDLMK